MRFLLKFEGGGFDFGGGSAFGGYLGAGVAAFGAGTFCTGGIPLLWGSFIVS